MRRIALAAPPAAVAAVAALVGAPVAGAAGTPPPAISARAAILVQPDTGDVVYDRAENARRPVASTTKLMTALITLEHANLDDTYTAIRYPAGPSESLMGLRAGERVTVRDLLTGLLLASGNDAAATLAVRVGGSKRAFVRLMNDRARQLGLRDTHYENPVGLDDPRNYSSAEDLAKLALILLRNPFFARTVDRTRAVVRSTARSWTVVNRNTLVREVPWVDGVKTGHTSQAGYVLVGAATRDGVRLVSAVVGDPTEGARDADSLALLRYGLSRYRAVTPFRAGRVMADPKLRFRGEHAELVAARTARVVVRDGERVRVRVDGVPAEIDGPLRKGQRVGTIVVLRRGRAVARVPLVTASAVDAASLANKISSALSDVWVMLLVAAVAACSLHVALRRRRRVRRAEARARRRGGTEAA